MSTGWFCSLIYRTHIVHKTFFSSAFLVNKQGEFHDELPSFMLVAAFLAPIHLLHYIGTVSEADPEIGFRRATSSVCFSVP